VRINELIHSPKNTPESNLVTALELIRNRYKDKDKLPKISTQSLINMVLNTDKTFDYDALVSANENNPAVKNLIKSFNQDTVELRPAGEQADDEATTTNPEEGDPTQQPVDTVDDMAKRAAKKRDASIF
jgi:hypothetical protein